jgi:glutamine synthetase
MKTAVDPAQKHPALAVAAQQEAQAFLAAHADTRFVDIIFTGLSGTARGKRIRVHELAALYESGRPLPVSILVADVTGQDSFDTGLVWENGDSDRFARPAPGTLVPAALGRAAVITSLYEADGRVCEIDCRAVLARAAALFTTQGLTPVVACELEFYLVERERADGQAPQPARMGGARPSTHGTYGLEELDDAGPFLADLWAAADAAGLPLETAISEYAPGQMELTLKHRADPLRVADDVVLYKRLVKQVARRHGMLATFMAKPFADAAGNGLHLHVSVNDANGANIFASPAGAPNAALLHAIGGLKAALAESFAIFAPGANSYRRFRSNSFAPVAASWGNDNRTTSFRITAGPDASRHIEHRIAGADANPYLALAALLAGVAHGLAQRIDPGPAVVGDGYAAAAADPGAQPLPGNWFAAVDALEQGSILKSALGDQVITMFASVKRTEQERYMAVVPPLDHDWYLANA